MTKDEKYSETLRLRIDPTLLELLKTEADKQGTDVSTYVRWCIRTGLYLEELNMFIKLKREEEETDE